MECPRWVAAISASRTEDIADGGLFHQLYQDRPRLGVLDRQGAGGARPHPARSRKIQAGDDIYAWMERRHDAADHVLCVVSDEYLDDLKAPFSALERRAAQWQAASKRPRFALFAVVKPASCDAHRPHPPLRTVRHPRRRRAHPVPRLPHRPRPARRVPRPAVSNIPIRVPTHFMGRDDALAQIDAALAQLRGPRRDHGAAWAARRRQDHARRRLRRAPSRRLSRDLVDQGAGGNVHARRSRRPRHPARLGRRRRQGGAGARCGDGAAAPRGRGHFAHLRQRDRRRCAETLSAARRRGARAGHLQRPCLARRRRAGRNPPLAQGDRRGLPDRPHRPRGRARRRRGLVAGARRPAARARAGGGLLRTARNFARRISQSASRPRRRGCSTLRAMRPPSITTA